MTNSVYVLNGYQTDFSRNFTKEEKMKSPFSKKHGHDAKRSRPIAGNVKKRGQPKR
jgi:hypothetical protein